MDSINFDLDPEIRSCPLCSNGSFKILSCEGTFELSRCHNCGMLYTRNPPNAESKKVYYEMMARKRMDSARALGVGYYTLSNQIKSVPLYSQALRAIRDYFPNGTVRIIDVGCAGGLFLLGAQVVEDAFNTDKPSRFDVRGVAFEPMEKRDTETYSGAQVCIIEEAGEKLLNWADVVTMFNVLEHVNDLKKCLQTVTLITRDEGFVLVDVPNSSVMELRGRLLGRWPHLNLYEHINFFTPGRLDDLMRQHGFDCVNRLPGLIQGASGFGVRPTFKQWLRWVLASILFLVTRHRIQVFSHITSVYVSKRRSNTKK